MVLLTIYMIISLIVLLVDAGLTGYRMNDYDYKSSFGALIWPVTISILIGQLIRIYREKGNK